ncbi:MAG: cytochrome-c peroxidase, partial [Myxococcota bacterium]
DALANYMDSLTFPARELPADPAAVARGEAIFQSEEAACASCHSDARLAGPGAFDVGTGLVAHVPGLIGLSFRAPYMHTGCAETIEARFQTWCGGDQHGSIAHLDEDGLGDLVTYLESL